MNFPRQTEVVNQSAKALLRNKYYCLQVKLENQNTCCVNRR